MVARRLRDLQLAAGSRAVWGAFAGSLCILLGSLSPAYLPQASPFWSVLPHTSQGVEVLRWLGTVLVMLGLALMFVAWFRLRPSDRHARERSPLRNWAVLVIACAPLLLAPPVFSHDVYSYVAHGWLLHNGLDPYQVGPGALPGYVADQVAWVWRDTPAPYGPLSLRISQGLMLLGGFDPLKAALLHRIPAIVGVALIGFAVPRIAGLLKLDRGFASWFVTLNPLLLIDFVGGAHNDALMTGFMVLGIWLTLRFRDRWFAVLVGAVAVGVGASIKQPAIIATVALPFLVRPWTSFKAKPLMMALGRSLLSLGIGVLTFCAITFATRLGFGWLHSSDVPGQVDTVAIVVLLGRGVEYLFAATGHAAAGAVAFEIVRQLGYVIIAVGMVVFAVKYLGTQPLRFVSWSLLWFALWVPAMHSWYFLWGAVLLPMSRPPQRLMRVAMLVTAGLLTFSALNFGMRNGPWPVMLVLVAVIAWGLYTHELSLPRRGDRQRDAAVEEQ
ncbi:polyprenol phosphomannose-dependent alpha 1,6 mannosyltransferase MptB [uncultured Tessaracoccus sp.]|uniref:polyprenol phosphomannose-dependent alpha 1,6 mannosyltransferase MptB n=1 Tax=uncultured Tessaracoccus sp. TaxID=905023 RepID=UPI00262EBE7E|nr:polyprenol phosphomannose-dependent alpha 1,6 mannosyltransferase MptB [uncultured Tessaracoccus sp.]